MDPIQKALALKHVHNIVKAEVWNNIWTFRLTCIPEFIKEALLYVEAKSHDDFDDLIVSWLEEFDHTKFPYILCYRETASSTGKYHYHIRVCSTIWKTRKSICDTVQKRFPYMKGSRALGCQVVHLANPDNIFVKSSLPSVLKSVSYVCKDGLHVYSRGYTPESLAVFEKIGSSWKDTSKLPIYKRIAIEKQIKAETKGHVVVRLALNWYAENKRDLPTTHHFQQCLTNIKLHVDKKFKLAYLEKNSEFYDSLNHFCT